LPHSDSAIKALHVLHVILLQCLLLNRKDFKRKIFKGTPSLEKFDKDIWVNHFKAFKENGQRYSA